MNYILARSIFNRMLHRNCFNRNITFVRTFTSKPPNPSQKSSTPDPFADSDKPVDFLESPAASWKAQYSTAGSKYDAPWMEMWSILFSVSIFMLYFCVLREENDIDDKIRKPLYETVPGLEEQNLIVLHKYNIEQGQDNREVETRMRELGMDVNAIRRQY